MKCWHERNKELQVEENWKVEWMIQRENQWIMLYRTRNKNISVRVVLFLEFWSASGFLI